jgi:hypothetical protein
MARKRAKLTRYDPLAPSFKYQRGYKRAVKRRAQSQIDPLLGEVNTEGREAAGAHNTRAQELTGWYNHAGQEAKAGFDRLQQATQGLLGSASGYQGDAQGALASALRQQQGDATTEAAKLGVSAPAQQPGLLESLQATGSGNQLGLTGDIAGLLGRSSADIGITGLRGAEAGQQEGDRYRAITDELTKRRRDIMGTLPGLREQARGAIDQEELGKAGQRFQQGLARDQFGLQEDQFGLDKQRFGEEKKTGRAQRKLARQQFGEDVRSHKVGERQQDEQLGISHDQVANERERIRQEGINAVAKGIADDSEAKAKSFNAGVESLQAFLKPSKAETRKNGSIKSTYKRSFDDAFDSLTMELGLSPGMAYRVLRTAKQFRAKLSVVLALARRHVRIGEPTVRVVTNGLPAA